MSGTATGRPALPQVADVLGADAALAERFELPGGMSGHAVEDPGTTLPASRQERIYSELVGVTTASFMADMTAYWAHRRRERYFERLSEFVLVADEQGRMVGWTGYQTLVADRFVDLYVDSTGMVGTEQSRGVMRALFGQRVAAAAARVLAGGTAVFLTARSESPVFYKLMRSVVGADGLFPQPGATLPADVEACARHLAQHLGQSDLLQPGSLVLRNAYGDVLDELYGELPSCGEPALDSLFRAELGPLDAYLIVGRVGGRPVR